MIDYLIAMGMLAAFDILCKLEGKGANDRGSEAAAKRAKGRQ